MLNDERGVVLDVEGAADAVARFAGAAGGGGAAAGGDRVGGVDAAAADRRARVPDPEAARGGEPDAPVTADAATCDDCLAELFDPADRRFRYPFVNCTNCGPRFTIVRGVPYDRPLTTMAGFAMCARCRAEYEDPRDRRFHAQPNACPDCGPQRAAGRRRPATTRCVAAAAALLDGAIVAVKGVGGYHLACRADDEAAVARLRARKHREDRPFALMARDLDAGARRWSSSAGRGGAADAAATGRSCSRRGAPARRVAAAVAPRSADLGVMLPYSPLHHLLLADAGHDAGDDQRQRLRRADRLPRRGRAASAWRASPTTLLAHDRPIRMRTDDSVVRAIARRARRCCCAARAGYVPGRWRCQSPRRAPLLACGPSSRARSASPRAGVRGSGHHIGDLRN